MELQKTLNNKKRDITKCKSCGKELFGVNKYLVCTRCKKFIPNRNFKGDENGN